MGVGDDGGGDFVLFTVTDESYRHPYIRLKQNKLNKVIRQLNQLECDV